MLVLLAASITSFAALAVAYMHRKQMRQIELYKLDPTVGLNPPLSPPVTFLKSYWSWIFPAVSVAALVYDMAGDRPITRLYILGVAGNVGALVLWIVGKLLQYAVKQMSQSFSDLLLFGVKSTVDASGQMVLMLADELKQTGIIPSKSQPPF